MNVSLSVSVASALVALVALALSVRQTRKQNLLPIALDVFRESRTADWFTARDFVMTRLAQEQSPEQGVSALPESARESVRHVVFFYDNLGVFVAYGVVNEDLAIAFHGVGFNEAWKILEPYIRQEREMRRMQYAAFYKDLVCRFRARPPDQVYRKLKLRRLGNGS